MENSTEKPVINSPGVIVLQWLTYAFWGWTALAILAISIMVTTYYIIGTDVNEMIPYGIAAVLVLLPISVICDLIYNKKEPIKKTGVASVVMIIHAVIFALCGVGALVTIVLNLVKMLINGASNVTQVFLICAAIMVVAYSILFIRTIAHGKMLKMRKIVILIMALMSIALIGLSFAGPVINATVTKNDKLIENNISNISSSIDSYVSSNNKLPDTLSDINLGDEAKKLVTDNLVTYKKESSVEPEYGKYLANDKSYKYQLCVTYTKADTNNNRNTYSEYKTGASEYTSYPSTYGHPAGEVCYKIKTY